MRRARPVIQAASKLYSRLSNTRRGRGTHKFRKTAPNRAMCPALLVEEVDKICLGPAKFIVDGGRVFTPGEEFNSGERFDTVLLSERPVLVGVRVQVSHDALFKES